MAEKHTLPEAGTPATLPPQSEPSLGEFLWPQTAPLRTLEDLIEEHAEELDRNGGDLEAIPAIAALLAFDEEAFHAELERWALKVLALQTDSAAAKVERVRIELKEKRWEKAAASLKGYMLRQMQARNVPKLKTPRVSISAVRNSQPTSRARDESALEQLFATGSDLVEQVVTYKLNREKVLAAAEAGELPEEIVVERGSHVRIS